MCGIVLIIKDDVTAGTLPTRDALPALATRITDADLLALHQTLDRLLNDDDEQIRDGASEIVQKGLKESSPISRDRADQLWGSWVQGHIQALGAEGAKPWIDWLSTFIPKHPSPTFENTAFSTATPRPDVLFEVESSNLFRDPATDAARASQILSPSLDSHSR
jgi:hypothetical protein